MDIGDAKKKTEGGEGCLTELVRTGAQILIDRQLRQNFSNYRLNIHNRLISMEERRWRTAAACPNGLGKILRANRDNCASGFSTSHDKSCNGVEEAAGLAGFL